MKRCLIVLLLAAQAILCSAEAQTPLRQSTSRVVRICGVVAVGDGFTPVTSLTLSGADEAEVLRDNTATLDISGATWAAVTGADGCYSLTLDTTATNTVGELVVEINDDSLVLPIWRTFQVVEEAVYDALYASSATGLLPANVTQWNSVALSTTNPLPNAAAGATNGLLINGANTGTSTFGAWTLADFNVTAQVNLADGLDIARSTSNATGLTIAGNGTGNGATFTSGSGATGDGARFVAASTNGSGAAYVGTGTGNGITGTGGSTSGEGMNLTGGGTGDGLRSTSGGGATGAGAAYVAASTNGNGIALTATGSGTTMTLVPANATQIGGQTASASGTVTFPNATLASTTNITGGTITTVTNLTNAPTNGDLTATMKTSVQTAAAAALTSYDPPTRAEATADRDTILASIGLRTTITVTDQDTFTLAAGATFNDAYNGWGVKINDAGSQDEWLGKIEDYVGSTKTVELNRAAGFTIATGDTVTLYPAFLYDPTDHADLNCEVNTANFAGSTTTLACILTDTDGAAVTSASGKLTGSEIEILSGAQAREKRYVFSTTWDSGNSELQITLDRALPATLADAVTAIIR